MNQQNLFGTDGIRARVGTFPLTNDDLIKLGNAIGLWAIAKYGPEPRILLGHDTRESAEFVMNSLLAGLFKHPIDLCYAGTLPTPALIKLALKDTSIDGAIIITASHNPYQDNGIKIIDSTSLKLSLQDEQAITDLFYQQSIQSNNLPGNRYLLPHAHEGYLEELTHHFPANFLHGIHMVLDCAHGATSAIAAAAFEQFGARVTVINNQPNGRNINHECGATHPESAQDAVIETGAHIGFAFDGDGDRIVAINNQGSLKDGDDILALLLEHPAYQKTNGIVCTVMSNGGLDAHIAHKEKTIFRTPVGDKYVSAELQKKNLLLGGEQSGHILLADFLLSSDAIFAALRLCEVALLQGNWELNSFERLAQVLINVPVKQKRDLTSSDLQAIITRHQEKLGEGKLLVRYSGTENLLRIMVEHKDQKTADLVGNQLANQLTNALR